MDKFLGGILEKMKRVTTKLVVIDNKLVNVFKKDDSFYLNIYLHKV